MNFSVVLPVYNVGKYIERCLLSLQSQTYKNFEMIFVDDCGDDNSIDIVSNYAKNDDRIRIVKNSKNVGTYHARRVGVENAKGKYIVFLDPDDELEPEALNILSSKVVNKPDVVFFGSRRVPAPKLWQASPAVPVLNGQETKKELMSKMVKCKRLRKGTEGKAFNTEFITKVYTFLNIPLGSRLVYGEDYLLFSGVVLSLKSACSTQDNLYVYHKNDTSITVDESKERVELKHNQVQWIIDYISDLSRVSKEADVLKKYVISNLESDALIMRLQSAASFGLSLSLYWKIFTVSLNMKDLVKLVLFAFTFGKFKA